MSEMLIFAAHDGVSLPESAVPKAHHKNHRERPMGSRCLCILGMLVSCLLGSSPVTAVTLNEYGINVTDVGLIDNRSGLEWFDAAATEGTAASLDQYFANGWRIATEQELFFLLTRIPDSVGDTANSELNFDDYLVMLEALSIPHPLGASNGSVPWLCRADDSNISHCSNSDAATFVSFFLFVEPVTSFSNGSEIQTAVTFIPFISSAYLYGTFETECPDCVGRSLLVRAVPLPAGFWLLSGALFALSRKKNKESNGYAS